MVKKKLWRLGAIYSELNTSTSVSTRVSEIKEESSTHIVQ